MAEEPTDIWESHTGSVVMAVPPLCLSLALKQIFLLFFSAGQWLYNVVLAFISQQNELAITDIYVVWSLSCVWFFWDHIVCSPPESSVHGISQARILEWADISFSRGSSWSRDRTHISCMAGRFFTTESPVSPCIYLYPLPFGFAFHLRHNSALSRVSRAIQYVLISYLFYI